jgi:hypothetical protein
VLLLERGDECCRSQTDVLDPTRFADSVNRALGLVPGRRLAVVLTANVDEQFRAPAERLGAVPVVQARDRGSAVALTKALLHIADRECRATVLVLPEGRLTTPRNRLVQSLAKAAWGVRCRPDLLVMIGARPTDPVPRQPWVQPGAPIEGLEDLSIRAVKRFVPCPSAEMARELYAHDALTATQLMAGTAERLLELPGTALDTRGADLGGMIPPADGRTGVLSLPDALPFSRSLRDQVTSGLCEAAVA